MFACADMSTILLLVIRITELPAFEDLPDDWVCPVCGMGKDAFEPAD